MWQIWCINQCFYTDLSFPSSQLWSLLYLHTFISVVLFFSVPTYSWLFTLPVLAAVTWHNQMLCCVVDRLTLAAAAPLAPRLLHRTLHPLVLHSWAELRRLLALPLLLLLLLRSLCFPGLVLRSFGGHGGNYLAWQRRKQRAVRECCGPSVAGRWRQGKLTVFALSSDCQAETNCDLLAQVKRWTSKDDQLRLIYFTVIVHVHVIILMLNYSNINELFRMCRTILLICIQHCNQRCVRFFCDHIHWPLKTETSSANWWNWTLSVWLVHTDKTSL